MEPLKLTIAQADLGRCVYFEGDKPCCVIGHYLAALGIGPVESLHHIDDPRIAWLKDTSQSRGGYTTAWSCITNANDDSVHRDYNTIIRTFAEHGVEVEFTP